MGSRGICSSPFHDATKSTMSERSPMLYLAGPISPKTPEEHCLPRQESIAQRCSEKRGIIQETCFTLSAGKRAVARHDKREEPRSVKVRRGVVSPRKPTATRRWRYDIACHVACYYSHVLRHRNSPTSSETSQRPMSLKNSDVSSENRKL